MQINSQGWSLIFSIGAMICFKIKKFTLINNDRSRIVVF